MKLISIAIISLFLTACAGTVNTYNSEGKIQSKTPAAVAVAEAAALGHEACGSTEQDSNLLSVEELAKLSASAQAEYMKSLPMLMAMGVIQAQAGDPTDDCHAQVASEAKMYFKSQETKYAQYGKVGVTGLIAIPTAWVLKAGLDTVEALGTDSGDTVTTGDIMMTKSDDPTAGEGGTGGDVNGSQVLNLGSGSTATDQGQVVGGGVDKNINTGFGNKSTSNQDNNTDGPNVINDEGDGAGNSGSLF